MRSTRSGAARPKASKARHTPRGSEKRGAVRSAVSSAPCFPEAGGFSTRFPWGLTGKISDPLSYLVQPSQGKDPRPQEAGAPWASGCRGLETLRSGLALVG